MIDNMQQLGSVLKDFHIFKEKPEFWILCKFSWLLNAVKKLKLFSNPVKTKHTCELDAASSLNNSNIFNVIMVEAQPSGFLQGPNNVEG